VLDGDTSVNKAALGCLPGENDQPDPAAVTESKSLPGAIAGRLPHIAEYA
jgi:hypothetical protein